MGYLLLTAYIRWHDHSLCQYSCIVFDSQVHTKGKDILSHSLFRYILFYRLNKYLKFQATMHMNILYKCWYSYLKRMLHEMCYKKFPLSKQIVKLKLHVNVINTQWRALTMIILSIYYFNLLRKIKKKKLIKITMFSS